MHAGAHHHLSRLANETMRLAKCGFTGEVAAAARVAELAFWAFSSVLPCAACPEGSQKACGQSMPCGVHTNVKCTCRPVFCAFHHPLVALSSTSHPSSVHANCEYASFKGAI
jgi:hypothetical protein